MSGTDGTARFGRYEILGTLGQGGFATVYRARDPMLGREVALKALLPHLAADPEVRRRFTAEGQVLARLHHPNIVTVHDVGEADGRPFFAMELIDGQTLATRLAAGPLPSAQTLVLLRDLASALDALHAAGLVHRDLKPANVMLERSGRVVLMDFGIARALNQTQHTRTGASLGTPDYMAPEQVRGQPVGRAADVYALGVLTYQLLAGRPPFVGDTGYLLHAHAYESPPPLRGLRPGLPEPIYAAVDAALAKDPAQRPPSAGAFVGALGGASLPPRPHDTGSPTVSLPPLPPRRRSAMPILLGVFGLVALALVGLVAFLASRPHPGPSPVHAIAPASIVPTEARITITPTITPTIQATASATSTAVSMPVVTDLRIYDNVFSHRDTAFVAGDSVAACLTLTPGADGQPLLVVATDRNQAPRDANDPGIVARSDGVPQTSTDSCYTVHANSGSFVPGPYYVWVLDGSTVLKTGGFRADPTPVPTPPPTQPPTPSPIVIIQTVTVTVVSTPLSRDAGPTSTPAPRPTVAPPDLGQPSSPAGNGDPSIKIVSVNYDSPPVAGGSFTFHITAHNSGATSGNGSISVSSPDALALSSTTENCNDAVKPPDDLGPGHAANTLGNGRIDGTGRTTLQHSLSEVLIHSWPAGASCTLVVTAQIPSTSSTTFLLRTAANSLSKAIETWPYGSGPNITRDQQDYPALRWVVPVGRP